jgi:cytochrome c oxidase subunit 4
MTRDNLPPRGLVLTWAGLLALLAATLALGYVPMGRGNLVAGLGISVLKLILVAVVFMKLPRSAPLTRFAAAAGLFWLALLFALSATDYLTRTTAYVESPPGGFAPEGAR